MAKYNYRAADASGKVIDGTLEAETTGKVLEFLAKKGLRPVSVTAEHFASERTKSVFGQSITVADKIFLTRYLALMLKVGTDLFRAINILIANFDKQILKSLLLEIRSSLEKGEQFYKTFAKYPKFFSPVFINLVKAGEASGNLEKIFEDLSVSLEKENELRNRIKSALVYPIILFSLSTAILFFLVTFALPRIAEVFSGGGFNPPLFSKIVFAVGTFLGANFVYLLTALIVLVAGGYIFFRRTVTGKRFGATLLNTIPIVRTVSYKLAVQRFASTLSSLMKAGLPIVEAINITADAVVHPRIKMALKNVAQEGISKGLTLGEAFARETIFPPVVINLVAIAEKAGHLDEVLGTLADFYDSEVSAAVKNLVTYIEPILLLLIGAVIGVIALSILVPVYQLVTQF
ncbi:MAG: type II secretion system F family protein [Candidatus Harrisonbacteria bacterium]|nr:type II secretion system F family protein [Candidatus Harrisonbacteria bacterium]